MRQQGDVTKACQTLQASSDNSPSYPGNSVESPGLGNNILEWGKGADNGMDSLYGSMQSEFTNLDLDHGAGEGSYGRCCRLLSAFSMLLQGLRM